MEGQGRRQAPAGRITKCFVSRSPRILTWYCWAGGAEPHCGECQCVQSTCTFPNKGFCHYLQIAFAVAILRRTTIVVSIRVKAGATQQSQQN